MKEIKQLGHNYVYHYDEFNDEWYCIERSSYNNYWSKTSNDINQQNWTVGKTIEQAAKKMIEKTKA